jgi:hypothetical protein
VKSLEERQLVLKCTILQRECHVTHRPQDKAKQKSVKYVLNRHQHLSVRQRALHRGIKTKSNKWIQKLLRNIKEQTRRDRIRNTFCLDKLELRIFWRTYKRNDYSCLGMQKECTEQGNREGNTHLNLKERDL